MGIDCRGALVFDGVTFFGNNIHIGNGSFINCGVHFDHGAPVTIGKNVSVAMRVTFVTSTHEMGGSESRAPAGSWRTRPITVGDGAWIGAASTILPGVTIGSGAVVGAGAVVTKDVPPNSLVMGTPARVMRLLDT